MVGGGEGRKAKEVDESVVFCSLIGFWAATHFRTRGDTGAKILA